MTEPCSLLQCHHMDIAIGGQLVTRDLNLTIGPGQCWCLLGRNGIGKTTLLHTLAGLKPADKGAIDLNGKALDSLKPRHVAKHLGILFQDQADSFPVTVMEKVLQGRHPYLHAWQWESADDHRIVGEILSELELEKLQERNIQTLSGGERQRVAIAALLAQQTNIMLLDEPTNHLDLSRRISLLDHLSGMARNSNKGLIMSLHDINLAARFCDHALLLLGSGETLQGKVDDILDNQTLEKLYGYPLQEITTPGGKAWLPL